MKVILTEKVAALGNIGEIINVSVGYARNFLFPRKVAVLADDSNKKQLEGQKRRLAKKVDAEKNVALEIKKKLDGLHLDLIRRVGANGKLFGSITTSDLSHLLAEKGIEVERRTITLDNPIKSLGNYKAKVKHFADVESHFTIKVIIDPAQAEELKKQQAEAVVLKKKQDEEAKLKAEARALEVNSNAELSDEQRLKAEADKLLRS